MHFQICGNNDGNIIHVFKNCISISVATVLEVSKMTVPICTSHWCLVMSFWLKVCIYSHTRGVKLGLGLGFNSIDCCYNIRSTRFPRISLYALTLRFVLIEIGATQYFWQYSVYLCLSQKEGGVNKSVMRPQTNKHTHTHTHTHTHMHAQHWILNCS